MNKIGKKAGEPHKSKFPIKNKQSYMVFNRLSFELLCHFPGKCIQIASFLSNCFVCINSFSLPLVLLYSVVCLLYSHEL